MEREEQAEVVVKKANTKDGNVGWDIRLQRQEAEEDEEYFARIVAMYDRCWKQWGKENANG